MIEVTLPDGTVAEFPAGTSQDVMRQAIQRHLGEAPPDQGLAQSMTPQVATPGKVAGSSAAATDGLLLGFGDEYLAGLSSVLGVQPDGHGGANWFDYSKPIRERYSKALDAIQAEQNQFSNDHPVLATSAEIAGSLAGPGKGAGAFINSGKTIAGRVARGSAAGAAGSAAYGFGEGEGGFENRLHNAASEAPLGALGGGALTTVGQGFAGAARALKGSPKGGEVGTTLNSLQATANHLFARAEAAGGMLPEASMQRLVKDITTKLDGSGYDKQLHPRIKVVLKRLRSEAGDKSLGELQILRRVASNAAASLQPDERRLASKIIGQLDEAVAGMSGGKEMAEAREVWARMRRMETLEELVSKASLTDNFESGLRSQFKALLRNPKRLRGFSEHELAAIRKVAKGGQVQNGLRSLGQLLSPTSLSGIALTGGAAFSSGGAALALPVLGVGARKASEGLASSNLNRARQAVSGGLLEELAPNPAGQAVLAPGLLAGFQAQHQ